jgi:hypothetical protein
MAGKYIKGALVEFMPMFLVPMPNVIVFQYNPESIVHTWTPAESVPSEPSELYHNPLAVKGVPGESFSFTVAMKTGIYARLAALEMLQYPTPVPGGGLVGTVSAQASAGGDPLGAASLAETSRSVPVSQVPTVLFVWGPGRILPVRVTGLTITEKIYDPMLNPTHAEAQLNLRVLTPEELAFVTGPLANIARVAYRYTQKLRQDLAVANLAETAEPIIGQGFWSPSKAISLNPTNPSLPSIPNNPLKTL